MLSGRHGDGRLRTLGSGRQRTAARRWTWHGGHGRNGARGLVLLCRQRVAGFDPAASASAIHGRHGSLSHAQARQARNGSPNSVTTMAPHGEAGIAPQGSTPRSRTRQPTHPTGARAGLFTAGTAGRLRAAQRRAGTARHHSDRHATAVVEGLAFLAMASHGSLGKSSCERTGTAVMVLLGQAMQPRPRWTGN
jgi:hypothetical protein